MINTVVDNDVLYKGVSFGLLPRLIDAIPAKPHELGVLGLAKFVISRKLRKLGASPALEVFEQFLRDATSLEPTEAEAQYAADLEYEAQRIGLYVDSGESQLCAIVIVRALASLVTGDKRAIAGIEALLSARREIANLSGKVICLEQLLLRSVQNGDPTTIRDAICTNANVDRTLATCFSCRSPEVGVESCIEALDSYIAHLRSSAPTILAP